MRRLSFAAVVLAAGRGSRMIGRNKMLAEIGGKAMIRRVAEAAMASQADSVIVVTGHDAAAVREALQGLKIEFVHNADYARGLSTSLRKGIEHVPAGVDAALILLGDMPFVTPKLIDGLHAALENHPEARIAMPVFNGRRGNPVLWHRSLFDQLLAIEGDVGARNLLAHHEKESIEFHVSDEAVIIDIDTAGDLARHNVPGKPV